MRPLTLEDFSGRVGTTYEVLVDGAPLPLRLDEAEPLSDSGRTGGSFRLMFRGPGDPVLPQATYQFRRDADLCEIFVVPVGRGPDGIAYEAVFF
jgi:hypothetical protein